MSLNKCLCGVSLVALAACGGGSTGSADINANLQGPDSTESAFLQVFDQGDAIADATLELPLADPSTLPTTGSASYTGVLFISAGDLGEAIGDMTLTSDFSDDSFSGRVTNLISDTEESLGGSLTISDGGIDREADVITQFTFGAELDGALTGGRGTYTVDATMSGDYIGTDLGFVDGVIDGTVALGDETATIEAGAFIGER